MKPNTKTERFELRCSVDEKRRLVELASMAGLSVAAYVLGTALGGSAADKIIEKTGSR